jgi:hypothetical protein
MGVGAEFSSIERNLSRLAVSLRDVPDGLPGSAKRRK